jgi:hypothetical protein
MQILVVSGGDSLAPRAFPVLVIDSPVSPLMARVHYKHAAFNS